MTDENQLPIERAEIVVPCADLAPTLDFFIGRLGFRLETISPADDPAVATISGHGVRIRLDRSADGDGGTIRLVSGDAALHGETGGHLVAPNGTRIEVVSDDRSLTLPPVDQSLVLMRLGDDASWADGRAGMGYRDLIPGRQGGRFIASHISIPDGGPVPDYVHHHNIRFQLIYCYRGWTRLVYEDQGPPFVLEAGDCVLQPPHIRHRVLEASPGLEVIEIGCPAVHDTYAEHDISLPTSVLAPDRDFGGQRFVWHRSADAAWTPWRVEGWEARDSGIEAATLGLAGVRVVRPVGGVDAAPRRHPNEFQFFFVLDGTVSLTFDGGTTEALGAGDCVTIPDATAFAWTSPSDDAQLLDVTLPGEVRSR